MLYAIKNYIRHAIVPILYFSGIGVMLYSILKNAKWGFLLLVFLIPQPNIWYKFHGYPMGTDFLDLLYLSVLIGMFYQKADFLDTKNSVIIILFIFYSYFSLWNCSFRFSLPLPYNTSNELLFPWKNYAQMIFLYFLAYGIASDEKKLKQIIIIISIVVLLLGLRSARNFSAGTTFSYDRRAGGPFELVGLGANHFGAFLSYYCTFFLGLFFIFKDHKEKWLFLATSLSGIPGLLFAYSRGAYAATFLAIIFFGIKKRIIFLLVIIFIFSWQIILPPSVVMRVTMTETEDGEVEASAAERLILWQHALSVFSEHPIWGIGFGGFGFTVPEGVLQDTHNFFVKTLCEQGIIGFILLLLIFFKALYSGFQLLQVGETSFYRGIGFGFMGCVLSCLGANLFGDRFSYYVLGGYFWILWGVVNRAIKISIENKIDIVDKGNETILEKKLHHYHFVNKEKIKNET